jgi:peptidyl-prolyl cis-trans isomerase A (cyclophilin A)
MKPALFSLLCAAILLTGCSSSTAPSQYRVKFDTSKGMFVVEVHRDWAPFGADRFYQLVKSGFYDDARFFRVVPGFVVQWGINKDPQVTAQWQSKTIPDDPVKESNLAGYVSFATSGPNTRTTQVFVNLANNMRLDSMGFAAFGRVIQGLEVVAHLYSGYGEQPQQNLIESEGNAYLQQNFPNLDYIKTARVE